MTLTGTSVTGNTANLSGGGLYVAGGEAVLSGGCLKTNTALRFSGGGAYADDGVRVTDTEITGNTPGRSYPSNAYALCAGSTRCARRWRQSKAPATVKQGLTAPGPCFFTGY